jgi:hypothetical protein
MSYLVQILLPTQDNRGRRFAGEVFEDIKRKLVESFGGVTAYTHSPAEGVWAPTPRTEAKDQIVIVEVMTDAIDGAWWTAFKHDLERRLEQDEIVIRSQQVRLL